MRTVGRTDINQVAIVTALRQRGCSVTVLSSVGGGCPDLLVGVHGFNVLMEVKDGNKIPSQRELTPDQAKWHHAWRGQVVVITCVGDAIDYIEERLAIWKINGVTGQEPHQDNVIDLKTWKKLNE